MAESWQFSGGKGDESIVIEYQMTAEEIAAFWAWEAYSHPGMYLKRKAYRRKVRRNLFLAWSATIACTMLMVVFRHRGLMVALALCLVLAIGATISYLIMLTTPTEESFASQQLPRARLTADNNRTLQLTINGRGIRAATATYYTMLNWSHFASMVETPQFLVGRCRDGSTAVLPKRCLGEGSELGRNLGRVRAWAAAANVGHSAELGLHLRDHDVPCPKCSYNLRGMEGTICPECGFHLEPAMLGFPESAS
jgi:hypothetical protein